MSLTRARRAETSSLHRRSGSLLVGGALAALLSVSWAGCNFGWDGYDPRLGGDGGAASTGTGDRGATTGAGGDSVAVAAATTSGAGGGSSSSTSTGTGGGGPIPCGGMAVLSDDFPGGDPGELWSTNSSTSLVSETGGEAVIVLPSNSPSGSWGEFTSNHAYDLRGDSVSIEVANATNPATTAQAWFGAGSDDTNYLVIYQKKGVLHFEYEIDGTTTSLKTIPYDPVAHRYWRIREDGTTTRWETSSDGASWSTITQLPSASLFPMDVMWVWFGAGSDGGEVNPGSAHFDHVNGGGPPTQKWCPISSFTDDFDDGARPLTWGGGWEDSSGMLVEKGGELVISLIPNDTGSAAYSSSRAYALTGDSLVIEVPSTVTAATGAETYVGLIGPGNNQLEMSVGEGHLYFSVELLGSWKDLASIVYSPTKHRWWRIRESANTVYWESSPDGMAWVEEAKVSPPPIALDALEIRLGSGCWMAQPTPGGSRFDNLNLPPP